MNKKCVNKNQLHSVFQGEIHAHMAWGA